MIVEVKSEFLVSPGAPVGFGSRIGHSSFRLIGAAHSLLIATALANLFIIYESFYTSTRASNLQANVRYILVPRALTARAGVLGLVI